MKGDPVPPDNYVARHCCRYTDIMWQNGHAVGVTQNAFAPRSSDNNGISVDWVDFFSGSRAHTLACVRSITKLQAKDTHRIALLQVRDLIRATSPIANLSVIHDPAEDLPPQFNAAHSLIRETADLNNLLVRERLAALVKPGDLHPYR
jgi:hypothetical protein